MGTDESTDEQAIAAVLGGDSSAYETLVRRYQDRLFNTLTQLLRDEHEAEEVTQEAMLQAYAKLSSFRGHSAFYTWLYRIAFNLAMSRKRKRRPEASINAMEDGRSLEIEGDASAPDHRMVQGERAEQVHEALDQLGEDFRAVLILREMEGFDYETIGSMLEVPVGTVRSRLSRARGMLRDVLREMIGEPDLS